MGFEAVRGDQEVLFDPVVVPHFEKFVDRPVERLPGDPGPPVEGTPSHGDAVGEGGCSKNTEAIRHLPGDPLGDDDVRSEREMRPVLLECAYGEDQPRTLPQVFLDRGPRELIERV